MRTLDKRVAALRRYHLDRTARTRSKLLHALDRMENGKTRVIAPGFDWSKMSLAREAGVNINTVVRKISDGWWAFPDVNDRFDKLKRERSRSMTAFDAKKQVVVELRCEVEKLRKENRRLALEVNRIGRQIIDERNRADRMKEYERQNTSLREEINRIRLVRPTKARGKRL
jgi:hypothetical protein